MSDAASALTNASMASSLLADPSLATNAPTVGSQLGVAAAKKAGTDFEAFFLSQAFENMFSGIGTDPMFGGGSAENVYRSMLIQEYSKVAARSGMTGIGAEVTREILKMQEKQRS